MKVYILDAFHPSGIDFISKHAEVVRWDDSRCKNWHEDADAVMVRMFRLTAADFAKARKLKVVSKQGVGVNTIDLVAAKAHGITVCNTPGVNSEAVAEMALGLALSIGRRIAEFDRMIRAGDKVDRADFLGIELWEKTVGVVGMGNTGTRVARKYHAAFNAKILACDPYVSANHWPDIPHERVGSLDAMWPRVDVLTMHVPLTDETRGMVGRSGLARMKDDAIVINVSRGGVIDEDALYQTLKSGRLSGAGLDVWDEVEPPRPGHPLLSLHNVVATPHAAGGTRETQVRSSLLVAQQLLHVMNGGEPLSRVA
jgi:D-3-phosphoglycerate dehydrogenase